MDKSEDKVYLIYSVQERTHPSAEDVYPSGLDNIETVDLIKE